LNHRNHRIGNLLMHAQQAQRRATLTGAPEGRLHHRIHHRLFHFVVNDSSTHAKPILSFWVPIIGVGF
jgi:hypothetical protein